MRVRPVSIQIQPAAVNDSLTHEFVRIIGMWEKDGQPLTQVHVIHESDLFEFGPHIVRRMLQVAWEVHRG